MNTRPTDSSTTDSEDSRNANDSHFSHGSEERFVTHLESAIDGSRHDANQLQTLHDGRPLWVRYDLDRIAAQVSRETIAARDGGMYRFRELLPVGLSIPPVTFGENVSPLLPCPRLGGRFGLSRLSVKDESQLPTGSFKSRGLSMAVSMARHFGVRRLAIPTAGNAGGAMAAYAARAGIETVVLMPRDTPIVNQLECVLSGAKVFLVDGLINDCGRMIREATEAMGWFDVSTLKEPYRLEGKKTMGLELAMQLNWRLPDVIVYPTGGGTGLIGMWKAFAELAELGWLDDTRLPRMVSVQSSGCSLIAPAFHAGKRFADPVVNAHTIASGLRVPVAVGDFMIIDALRESGGTAVEVDETRITELQRLATADEGISFCPETAACIGAVEELAAKGWLQPNEHVVVFNTGAGQKYIDGKPLSPPLPCLSPDEPIDWATLMAK